MPNDTEQIAAASPPSSRDAGPSPLRLSRIERLLLLAGVVDKETLAAARDRQAGAKRPLVEVLLEQDAVDEGRLVAALADVTGMSVLTEDELVPDPDVQNLVPPDIAQQMGILPLRIEDGVLVVATGDPFQIPAFDELTVRTNLRVRAVFAAPSAVRMRIRQCRGDEETLDDLLKHAPAEIDAVITPVLEEEEKTEAEDGDIHLEASGEDGPVVKLLNMIIADAIRQGASDIHIEPERNGVRIRFRLDGDLHPALDIPDKIKPRLIARLKIVSGLSTIETRMPQDGRAKVILDGRRYDLRVSTIPSYFGEKAVIRILDQYAPTFSLDRSGIEPEVLGQFRELLERPQGLILVTGPTGSGKSTTLYAAILELREPTRNIVTVEDPVEYQFPGIVHVPVRSNIGMTFAAALRSILRQDPDTILIGEIRDAETAEIAIRSAMTGHLVLSTLHTNDAIGAVTRLLDLGLTPHLLGSCLLGVMGQRLVRTICDECSEPYEYPPERLARLKVPLPPGAGERTRRGTGCAKCRGTGFRGRTPVVELIRGTPELQGLITSGAEEAEVLAQAKRDGTRSLFESGVGRILEGKCTPEAVLKVTAPEVEVGSGSDSVTPECTRACAACGEKLQAGWMLCPFCGEEAPAVDESGLAAVVCDDSKVVRALVARALRPDFPRIFEAENGKVGYDLVSSVRPALLVVDHEMPEMTGAELIRELRGNLETAALPIIMLTGKDSVDLELEVLDLGADDYLRKPVSPERLRARAKAVIVSRQRALNAGMQPA